MATIKKGAKAPVSKTENILTTFAEQLRVEMAKKNINVSQLVRESGVSEPTVSGIKNGKLKNVSVDTLVKLATALGLEIEVSIS